MGRWKRIPSESRRKPRTAPELGVCRVDTTPKGLRHCSGGVLSQIIIRLPSIETLHSMT